MRIETIEYHADGLNMVGTLYVDEQIKGRRPGVLVFPEAFGVSEHAKERAQRLARLGYAALAGDLHGRGSFLRDLNEVMTRLKPLREDPQRARPGRGGFNTLIGRSEVDPARVAAIGFCFGGTMALELARGGADLVGVVGFHSGLASKTPADARNIKARIIICIGADDVSVNQEQRIAFEKEMREGGVRWQTNIYGGVLHSFTNPDADALGLPDLRYDATADARSWTEMCSFLQEVFG